MTIQSRQDRAAEHAASTACWIRLAETFPEVTPRSNYEIDRAYFSQDLHTAMGWRADHHDRY